MKKLIIFIFAFFTIMTSALAQDFYFAMPYANPLNLNPAFAGSLGQHRITAGYNMELADYDLSSHTVNIAYDNHCDKIKGGLGVVFSSFSDNTGCLVNMRGGLIYSPVFDIKEKITVKPAVQLSYGYNTTYNASGLNNFEPFADNKYMDIDLGVLAYTNRFFGGLAAKHLTNPNMSFYKENYTSLLPVYFTAHLGGFALAPSEERLLQIAPSVVFNMQGDLYQQFIYGVDAKYKMLRAGLYFTQNVYTYNNLAMGVGYNAKEFTLSFAHSFYQSDNIYAPMFNQTSNEFTLTWKFNCKDKEPTIRPLHLICD